MKCTKCGNELKFCHTTQLDDSVITGFYRCHTCWTVHCYSYTQPYLANTYTDVPRLVPMSSNSNAEYKYFKCYREGAEAYMLVAKRMLATRERLEAMGYSVEEPENQLPAYRLYELV